MVALGLAGALAGLPREALDAALRDSWKRDAASLAANSPRSTPGERRGAASRSIAEAAASSRRGDGRWLISGNEAAGLGAIRGGVRFVAAYPITPATELLEWMAPALAKVGGSLLQAEDELASINMIVGASFGGVPVADGDLRTRARADDRGHRARGQRRGAARRRRRDARRPVDRHPAKSEQSDLSYAVSGLHGDAPRLVVAPTSIADCLATTQWAVHLAEALQAPAIVLSDQFMGQSRAIIDRPADVAFVGKRAAPRRPTPRLQALPRHPVGRLADGAARHARPRLHRRRPREERGGHAVVGRARPHRQLDKRARKLALHDYGDSWADIEGDGELAVITFGSSTGAGARGDRARARARACARGSSRCG